MINISKISRSIVVIIFVALIIFLGYLNVIAFFENMNVKSTFSLNIFKLIYVIITIFSVTIYGYLKDKLNRMKVNKKFALVYRYIYITIIVVLLSLLSIRELFNEFTNLELILYILSQLINGYILKRIIFNVSKSDILSVLGMVLYAIMPNFILQVDLLFSNSIINFLILSTILVIQLIIDELKQIGIKTKKYIIKSIILGILMGLSILCGVNCLVWILIGIISLFITVNLDNTHINFPKYILSKFNQKNKEILYRVERINISKLIISIIIVAVFSICIYLLGNILLNNININNINSEILNTILGNTSNIQNINFNDVSYNLKTISQNMISLSKTYYMIIFAYIIFIEILSICLHRRYDTKSTIIKLIFILMLFSIALFNLNIYYFQDILTTLLILICIVNTSNIYLNREERIKMLVA